MRPSPLWTTSTGRELDTTPLRPSAAPSRIVACLNVWNDLGALRVSVPTWKAFVDHVIVVDGSYDTIGADVSTDGTLEFLRSAFPSIEIISAPGLSQCAKRTMYLAAGRPGDTLFVVDADEHVVDGKQLRALPVCDIGWVRMRSALYAREYGQPRLFRWRSGLHYSGRHHWIYEHDRLFCTHQYGGPGYAHRPIDLAITNEREMGRTSERKVAKRANLAAQEPIEAPLSATPRSVMSDANLGAREGLWILNYAYRDDGLAPSRFHTAINRTTPHTSLFFKSRPGPFGVSTQFDIKHDGGRLITAIGQCDIVHIHTVVSMSHAVHRNVPHVFHHHGSLLRANVQEYLTVAKQKNALVLVSNLELLSHTGDHPAHYLPNVVPVARYRTLAQQNQKPFDGNFPFRISHSPTHAERKGTKHFIAACQRLIAKGLPLQPVLIENMAHADALQMKSTCHAAFDSFWLGIQCSGLEAAAMGMPVIAGDPTVAARYRQFFGDVPYTFANDGDELEFMIRRLIEDPIFWHDEAKRVSTYVVTNHDESAVALTYLDYLDTAFGWRAAQKRQPRSAPTRRFLGART